MNLIACCDADWGLGRDGQLLVRIPEDLRRFRRLTEGKTVVLGRKTLSTFPGGLPLKNRRNIILSRNPGFAAAGAEVCRAEELPALLDGVPPEEIFVIGGAEIYRLLLPQCTRAYITRVEGSCGADAFLDDLDAAGWRSVSESEWEWEGAVKYRFCEYRL